MTPQVPEYVVTFEAAMRPLIAAIALGLIWIGATRMEGPAQSRYATAGFMSAILIGWLVAAQLLGSANTYFSASENAVPIVALGLLIPLAITVLGLAAVAKHCKAWSQPYRCPGSWPRKSIVSQAGSFSCFGADGRLPWQFRVARENLATF